MKGDLKIMGLSLEVDNYADYDEASEELQESVRMGDEHDDFHNTLLPFLLTVSCLLLTSFPHSHSQPPPPPPQRTCSHQSYACSINVSAIFYPFWERAPPCSDGDESLLYCGASYGNNPPIESPYFTVKEINDAHHTMKVMLTYPVKDVCSPEFVPTYQNLNNTLFQYSASVHNITTFFDGCSDHIPNFPSNRKFECENVAHYFEERDKEEEMLQKYPKLRDCKQRLLVPTAAPLEHYVYGDEGYDVLREAISDGFEVYYDVPQHCKRCNETDGSCWNGGIGEYVVSCKYCSNEHCSSPAENSFDDNYVVDQMTLRKTIVVDCTFFQVLLRWSPQVLLGGSFFTPALPSSSFDPACTPKSCGNGPSIKYPFWIPDEQGSFCGYPSFEITCLDKNPILRTSSYDFLMKDISYSNSSFTVANIAFYEDNCPVPLYNYSFDQTPFTYSSENWNLSFFYNCTTEPIDYPTYEVDCAKNASHYSFGVFHKEALEHRNYSLNECQFMVNVPFYKNAAVNFTSLLRMNYIEILKMGFLLNWTAPDCQYCETSGGRCGFDSNQFLCFCKDKSYLKTCGSGTLNLPRKILIGVGSGVVGALLVGICGYLYIRRRKNSYVMSYIQSRSLSSDPSSKDTEKGTQSFTRSILPGVPHFSYEELEEATNYFDSSKELGEGGFGTVYFGKLRDGRSVAVKRLYENNYRIVAQFMNEIKILADLAHPNLVTLYGCTSRHSRELLLVYEYIPNGTVADHLHGQRSKPVTLPWHIRINIAVETASALKFLHLRGIIHRDVKTNNILLDSNFRVKVADFGLSRLFPQHVTHVSTAPQGTPGYVDPEYHECYQLTNKSDVYSFGVVLVELISSLPAVDITRHRHEINLANMAINKIHNQALHELVDPNLGFESDLKVRKMVSAVAELAFQCLQSSKDMRPSMEEVADTLEDIRSDGKNKSQPEVMDISSSADDVVLLKNDPPPPSPDSNAVSKTTTPNTSG
ncbi:unnamed protein product [Sphenostylis stenocarpa]|uniref:non-specific serine/threonine protein kinase n=1 Tax=Sphenostylis stenocarpa TaxID=92480 RepID=A0AA86T5W4_9FABA|nr:unnamed protein product [Sphenostylis stenocarpa]